MFWIIFIIIIVATLGVRYYLINKRLTTMKQVKYKDIKNSLKSCDIILFKSSEFSLSGTFQQLYNNTPFTHIGIVYKNGDKLYILESHPQHYKSKNGHHCKGVCLYDIEERIQTYNGSFYIDAFYRNLTDDE